MNISRRWFLGLVGLAGLTVVVNELILPAQEPSLKIPSLEDVVTNDQSSNPNTHLPTKEYALEDYIQAIIAVESNRNPNAKRYEPHIDDTSYGLMQILTRTAKDLEQKHPSLPRLGKGKELVKNLKDPEVNTQYGTQLFLDNLQLYNQDPLLAIAAYNAGPKTPMYARVQQQLNDLMKIQLTCDGILGKKSQETIKEFQAKWNSNNPKDHLDVDGRLGDQTYQRIQQSWQHHYPGQPNPKGIIPQNNITPYHIKKILKELQRQ